LPTTAARTILRFYAYVFGLPSNDGNSIQSLDGALDHITNQVKKVLVVLCHLKRPLVVQVERAGKHVGRKGSGKHSCFLWCGPVLNTEEDPVSNVDLIKMPPWK